MAHMSYFTFFRIQISPGTHLLFGNARVLTVRSACLKAPFRPMHKFALQNNREIIYMS